jgi:hypothetical protein
LIASSLPVRKRLRGLFLYKAEDAVSCICVCCVVGALTHAPPIRTGSKPWLLAQALKDEQGEREARGRSAQAHTHIFTEMYTHTHVLTPLCNSRPVPSPPLPPYGRRQQKGRCVARRVGERRPTTGGPLPPSAAQGGVRPRATTQACRELSWPPGPDAGNTPCSCSPDSVCVCVCTVG